MYVIDFGLGIRGQAGSWLVASLQRIGRSMRRFSGPNFGLGCPNKTTIVRFTNKLHSHLRSTIEAEEPSVMERKKPRLNLVFPFTQSRRGTVECDMVRVYAAGPILTGRPACQGGRRERG